MNRKPEPVTRGLRPGEAAAALGALGGAVRSDAKAEAARRNGAKGGRPRKVQAAAQAPAPLVPPAVVAGLRFMAERTSAQAKAASADIRAAVAWVRELEAGR
jgi:hypothetical protein